MKKYLLRVIFIHFLSLVQWNLSTKDKLGVDLCPYYTVEHLYKGQVGGGSLSLVERLSSSWR